MLGGLPFDVENVLEVPALPESNKLYILTNHSGVIVSYHYFNDLKEELIVPAVDVLPESLVKSLVNFGKVSPSDSLLVANTVPRMDGMHMPVGRDPETGNLYVESYGLPRYVKTMNLVNVGDTEAIVFDGNFVIRCEKSINTGNEHYKLFLRSVVGERIVSFRRDAHYDTSSPRGGNSNGLLIKSTQEYILDDIIYGNMRGRLDLLIYDHETAVSWNIIVFGVSPNIFRFVMERHEDTPSQTPSPPIPELPPIEIPGEQ